ncbi:MAG: hypothetical protein Q9160_001160 [Pyrenula sp. 1 TL-2023]
MAQSRKKREVEKIRKEPRSPIDVFQFLDPSRNSTRTSLAGNRAPTSEITMDENSRSQSCARSLHSDSGISIRDSSSESLNRKQSDLEMVEEGKPLTYNRRRNLTDNKSHKGEIEDSSDESDDPESFYLGHEKQKPASLVKLPKKRSVDTRGLSGYDLLAHQLSEREIQPMYRRFDWLQHRNLLQLQDELDELEEELKRLDHDDARFRLAQSSTHGQDIPASRRIDCQWQSTVELCGRRVEILAIIQVKLKQYNKMLQSYRKLSLQLQMAHPEDVEEYHSWLMETHSIDLQETKFLDHTEDLVAVGRPRSHHSRQQSAIQMVVMTVAGSIMIPLLAFSVIPSYLPRIFVVVFTGLGLTRISYLEKAQELIQPEQFRTCLSVYLGVMLVAALTVL